MDEAAGCVGLTVDAGAGDAGDGARSKLSTAPAGTFCPFTGSTAGGGGSGTEGISVIVVGGIGVITRGSGRAGTGLPSTTIASVRQICRFAMTAHDSVLPGLVLTAGVKRIVRLS